MKKNNKGFSLVELIVVIAIMAILAAVAIPTFAGFITKANASSDASFVNDFIYAANIAHAGSDADITNVQITLDANGGITGAAYKVNGDVVRITVSNGAVTGVSAVSGNDEVEDAAETAAATMDWSYSFKTQKGVTIKVSDNKKEVETDTPIPTT